jgi:hypothetical protein
VLPLWRDQALVTGDPPALRVRSSESLIMDLL